MSTYINNRLFAYSYLPITNQNILDNYPNSLILIGSEHQLYQPLTKTYVGISKTAYNNTLELINDSKVKLKDISDSSQNTFKLLTSLNPIDGEKIDNAYYNNSLYLSYENNESYLYSSYFKGYLDGTSNYSKLSYKANQIHVEEANIDDYYKILFANYYTSSNNTPYDAEIEWLGTNNGGVINTNYIPQGLDIRISCKFYFGGWHTSGSYPSIVHAYVNDNTRCYRLMMRDNTNSLVIQNARKGNGSSQNNYTLIPGNIYEIDFDHNNYTINGTLYTHIDSATSIENTSTLKFLDIGNKLDLKFYYFKLWKGDTLILDMIPVRIGQTGYMFDKVSGQLFGNSNSNSTFILGEDKTVVDNTNYKSLYINSNLQYSPSTHTLKSSYFDGWLQGTADNAIESTYSSYTYIDTIIGEDNDINDKIGYLLLSDNKTGYTIPYTDNNLGYYNIKTNTLYANLNGNVTGSVDSADKLSNPVTIWGQTFDGSNNVEGDIDLAYSSGSYSKIINVGNIFPTTKSGEYPSIGDIGKEFNAIYANRFYGLTDSIEKIVIPQTAANSSYNIIVSKANTNKLYYYDNSSLSVDKTHITTDKGLISGLTNVVNIPLSSNSGFNSIITSSIYSNNYILSKNGFIHYNVLEWKNCNLEAANEYILLAGGSYISRSALTPSDYINFSYFSKINVTNNNSSYYITFTNINEDGKYGASYVNSNAYYNPYTKTLVLDNGNGTFKGNLDGNANTANYADNSLHSTNSDNSTYSSYSNYIYVNTYIGADSDISEDKYGYLLFGYPKSGYIIPFTDNNYAYYNIRTNTLYSNLSGNVTGNSYTSTYLLGGNTNKIVYQSSENITSFIDAPSNNKILGFVNNKFTWVDNSTDELVKQTYTTYNAELPILTRSTNDEVSGTSGTTYYRNNVTINQSTGTLSSYLLKITSGRAQKHIEFTRVGNNYIVAPEGSLLALSISNNIGSAVSQLIISNDAIYPGTSNAYILGKSTKYWLSGYITNTYSDGFYKNGSSNDYVLLGAGDHKLLSELYTDERVKYSYAQDNKEYKLLFSKDEKPINNSTSYVSYNTNIKVNPSTSTITASIFTGRLNGNADTATLANDSTYSTYTYYAYINNIVGNDTDINEKIGYLLLSDSKYGYNKLFTDNNLAYYNIKTNTLYANLNGNVTGQLTGNADTATTATKLSTTRKIWGQEFDGTNDVRNTLYVIDSAGNNITASAKIKFSNLVDTDASTKNSPYIQGVVDGITSTYGRKRLGFFVSNDAKYNGDYTEALSILPTAYIGIGITNPSYKLHVNGNTYSYGFIKKDSSNSYVLLGGGGHKLSSDFIQFTNLSYTNTGKSYKVDKDANNNLFVTVPWTDNNDDTKVTQTSTSYNYDLPILVRRSAVSSSGTAGTTYYKTNVTINPNTETITASVFNGDLSGNATTATDSTYSTNSTYSTYSNYVYVNTYIGADTDIPEDKYGYLLFGYPKSGYIIPFTDNNYAYYNIRTNTVYTNINGNATTASNLVGGVKNSIPYQTANNITSFIDAPTNNTTSYYVLGYHGNQLSWQKEEEINIFNYSKTLTINVDWTTLVSISSINNIGTGTFIINMIYSNTIYSGILSYNSNNTQIDEIILHASGNNSNRLYLRINGTNLQIAATTKISNAAISLKIKKLI